MNRRFIAMCIVDPWPREASPVWIPRNNKLYDFAGQDVTRGIGENKVVEKIDNGYVLMADLDALPRVTFDAKGKPVGIARDVEPTPVEQYEEAERMLEVWAKRAEVLRNALRNP